MANHEAVVMYSNFNPQALNFAPEAKLNKNKGKSVPVTYGPNNSKLLMQTPVMQAPFGISKFVDEKSGSASWTLDLSFKDMDKDPKLLTHYNNMLGVDRVALESAVKYSENWMERAMPEVIVTEFYKKCVKTENKSKKTGAVYPPSFKVKLPPPNTPEAVPVVKVFNEQGHEVSIDYVTSHCAVKAIIELRNVWFMGKTLGLKWMLEQVQVVSRPQKLVGYAFQAEDDNAAIMDD